MFSANSVVGTTDITRLRSRAHQTKVQWTWHKVNTQVGAWWENVGLKMICDSWNVNWIQVANTFDLLIDGFSHVVAYWHVQNDGRQVRICNILQWLAGWKVTRTSYSSPGDVRNSSSWYLMAPISQHIGLSRPCSWRCQRASAWGGNWGRDGHREKATKTCHGGTLLFLRSWMWCDRWSRSWFWEVCFLPGCECTFSSCDRL